MSYQIRFEDLVANDLEDVRNFLERFPDAAPFRTLGKIMDEIVKLSDWPNSHPRLDENPLFRKLSVDKYNVLYLVDEERKAVQIQFIYHQSRHIKKVLSRETPTLARSFEYDLEIEEEEEIEFD